VNGENSQEELPEGKNRSNKEDFREKGKNSEVGGIPGSLLKWKKVNLQAERGQRKNIE